jgi:hypothetical protein
MKNSIELVGRRDWAVELNVNGERFFADAGRLTANCFDRWLNSLRTGDHMSYVMTAGSSHLALGHVLENADLLKACGMLERATVASFTIASTSNAGWPLAHIERHLRFCDKVRLLTAGDPLPEGDPLTVYRGVAGDGTWRKVRGLSWTLDPDLACWFACRREDLVNPAVMVATIRRSSVWFYSNGRDEQEVVVRPSRCRRFEITLAEMKHRSGAIVAERMRMQAGKKQPA